MKKVKMKIPKQKRIKYIGGLKLLLARSSFYISILNFLMLASTSYVVVIKKYFYIPFWLFLLSMVAVVVVVMIFEWAVMLPSEISFTNWQTYEHNNPIRKDLEFIKQDLDELKKKIL